MIFRDGTIVDVLDYKCLIKQGDPMLLILLAILLLFFHSDGGSVLYRANLNRAVGEKV